MVKLNYGTITMIFSWPEFLVMTRNIILYTACVKHSRWQKEYQILTWRKIKPLQLFQSRSCHHISKSAQSQKIHIFIILLFSVQSTLSLVTTAYNFNCRIIRFQLVTKTFHPNQSIKAIGISNPSVLSHSGYFKHPH